MEHRSYDRAVQRAGELLSEIEKQKTGPKQLKSPEGQKLPPTHKSTLSPEGQSRRAQAAVDAGLTPTQAKTAIEVARLNYRLIRFLRICRPFGRQATDHAPSPLTHKPTR